VVLPILNPIKLLIVKPDETSTQPVIDFILSSREFNSCTSMSSVPDDLQSFQVIVIADTDCLSGSDEGRIAQFVGDGGGCVTLLNTERMPSAPIRVDWTEHGKTLADRMPDQLTITDALTPLTNIEDSADVLLEANWRLKRYPVAVKEERGRGVHFCTSLGAFDDEIVQRLIFRFIRAATKRPEQHLIRTGIVGFGNEGSAGYIHTQIVSSLQGMELTAICDLNPRTLEFAKTVYPEIQSTSDIEGLIGDPTVELITLCTPPNTHYDLAIKFLRAGKHVIVEKPFCFTLQESYDLISVAEREKRIVTCYQNRRWDPDFLAIRKALASNLIGDLFYMETFVGAHQQPCDYWHSDANVSGGLLYDWGAHYIDWILNLVPSKTAKVMGTTHKKRWHSVSNADHVKAQIFFQDGQEANFIYSDIAAAPKPKWYILGSQGAIVGDWNTVTYVERNSMKFFIETAMPTTEINPTLTLTKEDQFGNIFRQELPMGPKKFDGFYSNLADHILTGEGLLVTPESASRVVAVLETATKSARNGGIPHVLVI
jgi:predicted dehydrogenase